MFGFYCFCSTKGKCSICLTSEKFKGKHYLLYQNCLDFKQDDKIVGNLLKVLKDLVSLNNHFVCGLINQKYYYATQNWFSGKLFFLLNTVSKNGRCHLNIAKRHQIKIILKENIISCFL